MHFFDPSRNFWGGHGIVGGQVPLGLESPFALKYRGICRRLPHFHGRRRGQSGRCTGNVQSGALWDLPVVFIIENNGYSDGDQQRRSSAGPVWPSAPRPTAWSGISAKRPRAL